MQALDLFEGLPVEAARHSLKHHDQEYDLVNEGVFTCFFTRAHEQAMPELPDRLPLAIDRRRSFRDRLCRSRSADSGMGLRQMCELRENGLFVTVVSFLILLTARNKIFSSVATTRFAMRRLGFAYVQILHQALELYLSLSVHRGDVLQSEGQALQGIICG